MPRIILFIDGENFINKLEDVLKKQDVDLKKTQLNTLDFNKLFNKPLNSFELSRKIFYTSRLHVYSETKNKSKDLIKFQRKLRNTLIDQGFEFIIAGNVRGQKIGEKMIFKEKGVDVRIAVDLVTLTCDKKLDTAIICSSDSDLQPAIKELRSRGVETIYLGFEINPNKGLSSTTTGTILFRNSEILEIATLK